MNANMLFASLCLVCVTGFIGAVEKKDAYVKLKLKQNLIFREGKAKNMRFPFPPLEHLGEAITDAMPVSLKDKEALERCFALVYRDDKKREVIYTLEDIQFVAAIKRTRKGFSVRITEI